MALGLGGAYIASAADGLCVCIASAAMGCAYSLGG